MEKSYIFSVFTENTTGVRSRIHNIFTRRLLPVESIIDSESEIKNIQRYTIVLRASEAQVKKIRGQLEKQIDVLKVFVNEEKEMVYQQVALYKIRITNITNHDLLETVIRENHMRILFVERQFLIIEKTGHDHEIEALLEKLNFFGILEFTRSGRIALTKPTNELNIDFNTSELNNNLNR